MTGKDLETDLGTDLVGDGEDGEQQVETGLERRGTPSLGVSRES